MKAKGPISLPEAGLYNPFAGNGPVGEAESYRDLVRQVNGSAAISPAGKYHKS